LNVAVGGVMVEEAKTAAVGAAMVALEVVSLA
jgi:hypothetical protein